MPRDRKRLSVGARLWIAAGLNIALLAYTLTAGAQANHGREDEQVFWTMVALLLLVFVHRRVKFAWGALVAMNGIPLALIAVAVTASLLASGHSPLYKPVYTLALCAFPAAEMAILLSAPVRNHLRSTPLTSLPGA